MRSTPYGQLSVIGEGKGTRGARSVTQMKTPIPTHHGARSTLSVEYPLVNTMRRRVTGGEVHLRHVHFFSSVRTIFCTRSDHASARFVPASAQTYVPHAPLSDACRTQASA